MSPDIARMKELENRSTFGKVLAESSLRRSCDIRLHPRPKRCDDSCIAFCVGQHAADLSRFRSFFPNRIAISRVDRIFTVQIESPNVLRSRFQSESRGRGLLATTSGGSRIFARGVRQLVPLECPKPLHALSASDR